MKRLSQWERYFLLMLAIIFGIFGVAVLLAVVTA